MRENSGNTYLYYQTAAKIESLILSGGLKPGDKLPSERKLAEQLKSSYVTLRAALAVLSEKGIIGKIPRSGTVLKKLPSAERFRRQIGLTVWAGVEMSHPGTLKALDAMNSVFPPEKYKIVIIFITPEILKKGEWDVLLGRDDLDGMLIRVQEIPGRILDRIASADTPSVFVEFPEMRPCVCNNVPGNTTRLTDYIISTGHKNIALLGGPSGLPFVELQEKSFLSTVKKAGRITYAVTHSEYSEASAMQMVMDLKNRPGKFPTAFITGDDFMAVGAMKAVKTLGLRCPEDVSICCFGGYSISEQAGITVMRSPVLDVEIKAAEILKDRLETGRNLSQQIIMDGELIVRNSTARATKNHGGKTAYG